jgi:DNA polymerase-3 subunit beta
MNFIVSSNLLLRHLQSISGVLTTNNSLPILDNFLFEINDGQLVVSASDVETTMKTSLTVDANESGKIAIPAKLLLDILKNLPEQPCTFLVDKSNYGIRFPMIMENLKWLDLMGMIILNHQMLRGVIL